MEEFKKQIILAFKTQSVSSTMSLLSKLVGNKENEDMIISIVNSLLCNTTTCIIGLEVVNFLIAQFSEDAITDNAFHWINYCVVHKNTDTSELRLNLLAKVIENVGETERFNKKFTSDYLLNIVKMCLTFRNELEVSGTLRCLSHCMKYYPGWFVGYREEIELFLIKFIEDVSGKHTQEAAIAFGFFLQTGSPGQEGVNYINNFCKGFRKLCNTVLSLYNSFPQYFGEREGDENEIFVLKPISSDSEENKIWEVISGRIINCLVFIKVLIEKKFLFEKQITPNQIINIFIRGFRQHCCLLEENTFLIQKETSSLTKIQIKLFRILQVFMIWKPAALLPFTYKLVKIFFNILEKSRNCNYCANNFYYKEQLYKTLNILLQVGNGFNHEHFQEMLIRFLLKDIDSDKNVHVLNLNNTEGKKGIPARSITKRTSNAKCVTHKKMCSSALTILKYLLETYPLKISQLQWQKLVSSVVQRLDIVHVYDRSSVYYVNDFTTVNLYEILILLLKKEYTWYTPTIHSIITILNKGLINVDKKISRAARKGLDVLELASYSMCSSLSIYNSATDIIDADFKNVHNEEETVHYDSDIYANISCTLNKKNESQEINIINNIKITESNINVAIPRQVSLGSETNNVDDVMIPERVSSESEANYIDTNERINLSSDFVNDVKSRDDEENELEQPVQKKLKTNNDNVNTMMSSFHDEVQC